LDHVLILMPPLPHRMSRGGRQCGPPGWRGKLHQAHDPATALAEGHVKAAASD